MSGFLEILESVFTPDKFSIKYNPDLASYYISSNNPVIECLVLGVEDEKVFIHTLEKCGIHGKESIQLVEKAISRMPNIKSISLIDGSTVYVCGINIKLAALKILSKGESWYNSLGYKSTYDNEEKEFNRKIIEKPFDALLDDCLTRYGDKDFLQIKNDIETNGSVWFPETNLNDTTKDYFTKINNTISNDISKGCNRDLFPKYKWLQKFTNLALGRKNVRFLQYNGILMKNNNPKTTCVGSICNSVSKLFTAGKKIKKNRRTRKIHRRRFRSRQRN